MFPLQSGRQGWGNPLDRQHGVWSIPLARHPNVTPAQGAHIIRSVTCSWELEKAFLDDRALVTNEGECGGTDQLNCDRCYGNTDIDAMVT